MEWSRGPSARPGGSRNPSNQLSVHVRVNLLLVMILAACGAPGSDSVFARNTEKKATTDSAKAAPVPPAAPRLVTKRFEGYYRRYGNESVFMRCGTTVPLPVTGTPIALGILKERVRWHAAWEGARMYGVFQGALVTDTPLVAGPDGDSVRSKPRTRFYLTDVDSFRTWRVRDCNGMKLPREPDTASTTTAP
jgi:hypothetical protein